MRRSDSRASGASVRYPRLSRSLALAPPRLCEGFSKYAVSFSAAILAREHSEWARRRCSVSVKCRPAGVLDGIAGCFRHRFGTRRAVDRPQDAILGTGVVPPQPHRPSGASAPHEHRAKASQQINGASRERRGLVCWRARGYEDDPANRDRDGLPAVAPKARRLGTIRAQWSPIAVPA